MNRRVEFSLNLDNPPEAALYDMLTELLRHRRAGEVIRQALTAYLCNEPKAQPVQRSMRPAAAVPSSEAGAMDEQTTGRIINQSAAMFGF
jgi:hypothetical protein